MLFRKAGKLKLYSARSYSAQVQRSTDRPTHIIQPEVASVGRTDEERLADLFRPKWDSTDIILRTHPRESMLTLVSHSLLLDERKEKNINPWKELFNWDAAGMKLLRSELGLLTNRTDLFHY